MPILSTPFSTSSHPYTSLGGDEPPPAPDVQQPVRPGNTTSLHSTPKDSIKSAFHDAFTAKGEAGLQHAKQKEVLRRIKDDASLLNDGDRVFLINDMIGAVDSVGRANDQRQDASGNLAKVVMTLCAQIGDHQKRAELLPALLDAAREVLTTRMQRIPQTGMPAARRANADPVAEAGRRALDRLTGHSSGNPWEHLLVQELASAQMHWPYKTISKELKQSIQNAFDRLGRDDRAAGRAVTGSFYSKRVRELTPALWDRPPKNERNRLLRFFHGNR